MCFVFTDLLIAASFFTIGILATYLFFKSQDRDGKLLARACGAAALWALAVFAFETVGNIWDGPVVHIARLQYSVGALLLMFYFYFAYAYKRQDQRRLAALWIAAGIISFLFAGLIVSTEAIVESARISGGQTIMVFGDYYWAFVAYFLLLAGFGYYYLIKKYLDAKGRIEKAQLGYVIVGSFIMGTVSMSANVMAPFFGFQDFLWGGPMSAIVFVVFALYAIVRYHLFDIKALLTEMLVFAILITVFMQIFLVENVGEALFRVLFLSIVIILSVFLLIGIYKEVEQRERNEHLASRLSDSISFAAHELRNPVTEFMIHLSMLLDGAHGKLQPEAKSALEECYGSAIEMSRNVSTFLNLNKLEVGKLEASKQAVNLQEIACECVADFQMEAKQKKMAISVKKKEKTPIVLADRFQVRHVINNLISNAVKYTPRGGKAAIEIIYDKKGRQIIFSIKDNGIGISPDVLPHLFTRYGRGGDDVRDMASGEGVGLFLARKIIELHGGEIWAESKGSGRGSQFFFSLPLDEKKKDVFRRDNDWSKKYSTMLTSKRKTGNEGEEAAVNYLKDHGYRILDRNYLKKTGELDIVAKFKNDLVFVEVKSKKAESRFLPAQNVNFFKQNRLIKTAQLYLKEKRISPDTPWQIDVMVVEIDEEDGLNKIEHLQNCVWAR